MVDELAGALDRLATAETGRAGLEVKRPEGPPRADQTEPSQRPVMRELPPFEPMPTDDVVLQGHRPIPITPTEIVGHQPEFRGAPAPRRSRATLVLTALACLVGGVLLGRFTSHLPGGEPVTPRRDGGAMTPPPGRTGPAPDAALDPDLPHPDLDSVKIGPPDAARPAAVKARRPRRRKRRSRRRPRRRRRARP